MGWCGRYKFDGREHTRARMPKGRMETGAYSTETEEQGTTSSAEIILGVGRGGRSVQDYGQTSDEKTRGSPDRPTSPPLRSCALATDSCPPSRHGSSPRVPPPRGLWPGVAAGVRAPCLSQGAREPAATRRPTRQVSVASSRRARRRLVRLARPSRNPPTPPSPAPRHGAAETNRARGRP